MDSVDLLAREDEFKKLNKQLEKKTESLMKEIEHVMQKQDFFSEFSPSLTLSPAHSFKKHCCDTQKQTTQSAQHTNNTPKKKTKISNKVINNRPQCTEFENGTQNHQKNVQRTPEFEIITQNSGNGSVESENGTQNHRINVQKTSEFELRTHNSANCIAEFENGTQNCVHSAKNDVCVTSRLVCDCCTNRESRIPNDLEFLYAFVSVNVKDKVLPQSFLKERVTMENVCKFLSSKVKLMQEQIDRLQNTIDKKASQCQSHMTQLAELESQRLTLINKANNMKSSTIEMKAKCLALQNKLDEKDRLYKEQRSETDKISSEVKRLKCKNASLEGRCATQEETIHNLRRQIELAKLAEKELRDSSRALSASHETAISRLEAQVKALTSRIDKQMALIDNLRRQNVLLTTEGALKALEKEYSDFLNQEF